MKRTILFSTVLLAAIPLMAADKDDVASAAKKLTASANYSWHTSVESSSQFKPGPTDGKTEKDGYTYVASTFGDNTSEALLKGTNVDVKGDSGWQSAAEVLSADGGGGGGGFNPTRFLVMRMQTFKSPADEVVDLANGTKELKLADGVYSGDMTEDAAKTRMSFRRRRNGGQPPPEITGAKGWVKVWVTDGVLTKYEFNVQGHMEFNGNPIDIDNTTTTEIKDVGKTKLDVPDDAKKKLS